MFVMAALTLGAVWLLERFVDSLVCVSWVALTFTVGSGLGQGLGSGEEACWQTAHSRVQVS